MHPTKQNKPSKNPHKLIAGALLSMLTMDLFAQNMLDNRYSNRDSDIQGLIDAAQHQISEYQPANDSLWVNEAKRIKTNTISEMIDKFAKPLTELGVLSLQPTTQPIYFFVSLSMPDRMLREYARDAISLNGILVFKGVTPGMHIKEFLSELRRHLQDEIGSMPTTLIDSRGFSVFGVKSVPTIVMSDQSFSDYCSETTTRSFNIPSQDDPATYQDCPETNSKNYYKITGAIPAFQAIRYFADANYRPAQKIINNASTYFKRYTIPEASESQDSEKNYMSSAELKESLKRELRNSGKDQELQVYESPGGLIGIGPRSNATINP